MSFPDGPVSAYVMLNCATRAFSGSERWSQRCRALVLQRAWDGGRETDRQLLPRLPAGMSGLVQRKSVARGNPDKH